MAIAYSNMMKLGTKAPEFNLQDSISGEMISLGRTKTKRATVILFICNHCPFVHHINAKLVEITNKYQKQGITFIAISSNSIESHPQDAPELMKKTAKKEAYPFPYLYDETQEVAKAYKAECTPDFFVFDQDKLCVYRGRFDETRPNQEPATGRDLSNALDALLSGNKVNLVQEPSMGCGIKWK